jgi:polar amino acid transport system substrate-binding protein
MKKILITLVLIIAIFPASVAMGEDITFAVGDFAPYHYQENGEIKGIFIDVVNEVSGRLGHSPKFVMYPWKRALFAVENGDVDGIISVYYTKKRDKFLVYPNEALGFMNISIFSGKENHLKVKKFSDLKNTHLFQVRGTSYGPEFDSQTHIFKDIWYCNDIEKQITLLDKRPFHVAIANEPAFKTVSGKLGLKDRFKRLYQVKKEPLYIGFSKANGEKGRSYAEKFGAVLKQMKKEGRLSEIEAKY